MAQSNEISQLDFRKDGECCKPQATKCPIITNHSSTDEQYFVEIPRKLSSSGTVFGLIYAVSAQFVRSASFNAVK